MGNGTIPFHDNAKPSLNNKADLLLSAIQDQPVQVPTGVRRRVKTRQTSQSQLAEIHEENITRIGWLGERNAEIARFVRIESNLFGLTGAAYQDAVALVDELAKLTSRHGYLSKAKLMEMIFDWFIERRSGVTDAAFIDYLERTIPQELHDISMIFPLMHLNAEEDFELGNVRFATVRQEYFDRIRETLRRDATRNEAADDKVVENLAKQYVGTTCAFILVTGDEYAAREIGRDRVEQVLDILRFYSPTVTHPEAPCDFDLKGRNNVQQIEVLWAVDEGIPIHSQLLEGSPNYDVHFTTAYISNLKRLGADKIAAIFSKPNPTELESEGINAVRQFARAIRMQYAEEQLVLLFVVLETLLLVNDNEPITQTMGQRLAFLIGKDAEERMKITKDLARWYGVRSAFIHHG